MGHTAQGKDLSPRIATKLKAGLVSDVVNIENDGGEADFHDSDIFWKSI